MTTKSENHTDFSAEAIHVENLSKHFGANKAVDQLSLSVRPGEIFGIVGPDGAGKTTTMRLLTSIMEPTSGDAWVGGLHIVKDSEAVKEHIGYMSQKFGLYQDLTVLENLDFYADLYGVPSRARTEIYDRLLSFSNLTPFRKRMAGRLSGGMKQKLGLACALVHTPKILFLDEPTNGVDPLSRRDFWKILTRLLAQNVTIFVSTAYLDEAERCTRLAMLHQGKLLSVGTPSEIRQLMRGSLVEIRSSQPRDAVVLLKHAFPPDSVTIFGDRIHLATRNTDLAIQEAKGILDKARIEVNSTRLIPPTLEDVFVSMLAEHQEIRP
ncbi:MAG: ABC transporter ATP-binding protein [Candidatus Riflebacteria bacterium]|nr:ABC transporter ATP-binding protein [Candidatus Riflebacteria bacterium]